MTAIQMPTTQESRYPVIGQRKIQNLEKELREREGVGVDVIAANSGYVALHTKIAHPREGPPDDEEMDKLLVTIGLVHYSHNKLDKLFGEDTHYIFSWKRGLWVANGDNGYYPDSSRIFIYWRGKLDKGTIEAISDSMPEQIYRFWN